MTTAQLQLAQRRSLGCHEFGHSLGLDHYALHQGDESCMEEVHWYIVYNGHDQYHINNYY